MRWLVLVESNTTGTGRRFCAVARELGLRPVVLTADPERYPYLREDAVDHLPVDTADPAAVLDACRRLPGGVAGIASSSEYFVATAAETAVALGLPAADPFALTRCRHKDRQRTALAAAGVPIPPHRVVTTADEAAAAATSLGGPVVVKPTTGSGSVGVRLCATAAEAAGHAGSLLAAGVDERGRAVPGRVLVEAFVDGPEFSVETFDGVVVGVVAKHLGAPPHFVETGHDFPALAPPPDLARTAVRAVRALGVDRGAAHTELRHGPAGPVVVEVNPRLAGGMIPVLVELATGVDLVRAVVALAAGLPVDLAPRRAGRASIRFAVADRSGAVLDVGGVDAALAVPGVALAAVTARPGTALEITHSFRDRFGYAVATGPDAAAAADRAAARLHATIR